MERRKSKEKYSQLLKSFLFIGIFWTVLIAALAGWAIRSARENATAMTLMQARSYFEQLVLVRSWASLHGGVYVPVASETEPNPYLHVLDRDVVMSDGKKLTLINPAYMTRQIADMAATRAQIRFHITSLNPIRPENAAEAWEAKALASFQDGAKEYSAWWKPVDPAQASFRYMAPLWTESSCLACHAKQGYKKGDLRGGISVTIPAGDILTDLHTRNLMTAVRYFLMWAAGMGGILFFCRLSRREYVERSRLIDTLEAALKDVKTLKGLIPICASCKKVRNDRGFWEQIETYVRDHSDAEFSHGICPECRKKLYADIDLENDQDNEPFGSHSRGK